MKKSEAVVMTIDEFNETTDRLQRNTRIEAEAGEWFYVQEEVYEEDEKEICKWLSEEFGIEITEVIVDINNSKVVLV